MSECKAHECKPLMILSCLAAIFLVLGIISFVKYLFF